MILIALAMVAIIAMAALSIDVVTLYLARSEAQRSADAAALAAARVISVSGVTGDPSNAQGSLAAAPWPTICTLATQVANTVASQNTVGGAVANPVTVNFVYNGGTSDCTTPTPAFATNPQVQVQVQRTGIPTLFARIWSRTSNSISATATAEVFNPSGTAGLGNAVPVQPRCVKPWVVPNQDPLNGANCTNGACQPFVNLADGSVTNPGISLGGTNTNGVIGESFNLFPDCRFGATCSLRNPTPVANRTVSSVIPAPPNLEYLPGQVQASSKAVPNGPSTACAEVLSNYAQAVAGCDQSTRYQCGVQNANTVDLSENPRTRDTTKGLQCLIQQSMPGPQGTVNGQDTLDSTVFPFQMKAGDNNLLGVAATTQISSSNSIVSLPIYDHNPPIAPTGQSSVTIVGFLQVFVNSVDDNGNVNVTVLNVSGCGNNVANGAVTGSSPVPVRLITQ